MPEHVGEHSADGPQLANEHHRPKRMREEEGQPWRRPPAAPWRGIPAEAVGVSSTPRSLTSGVA